MDKEAFMQKAKELISEGNLEQAKQFIDDHKEDLGDYMEQAKDLLKDVDIDGIVNKFKSLFS